MACGTEARTAMITGADLWLAEAGVPDRPGHADIPRSDLSQSVFVQTRGVLKKELTAHLRARRQMRLPKNHNAGSEQGRILDMVSIRERPAEAEDRAVPGHWEGDLLTRSRTTRTSPH